MGSHNSNPTIIIQMAAHLLQAIDFSQNTCYKSNNNKTKNKSTFAFHFDFDFELFQTVVSRCCLLLLLLGRRVVSIVSSLFYHLYYISHSVHACIRSYVCMYVGIRCLLLHFFINKLRRNSEERNTKHGERGHIRARFKSPTTKRMKILERNELKTISLMFLLPFVVGFFFFLVVASANDTLPIEHSTFLAVCDRCLAHFQISSQIRNELSFTGFILHPKSMLYALGVREKDMFFLYTGQSIRKAKIEKFVLTFFKRFQLS